MKKTGSVVVCALVMLLALAGTALGAGSRQAGEFRSSLVGSVPETVLAGVPSGGAPWTIASSQARLRGDGELRVNVEGLLLINTPNHALDGTTGPVRRVLASLVCANAVVASTASVPLDSHGNAEIRAMVSVPDPCFAPAVLVRIGALATGPNIVGPWIAATGL
jgi:hypothetical protein